MWFVIGFAIGLGYGCWLFWMGLRDYDELWQRHLDLLKEMERSKLFRSSWQKQETN